MRDVVISGGGPIGLYIATELGKMGYDVLVIEEHPDIGNPSHCSGLFSGHVFDITGTRAVLHSANRAKIVSPSGRVLKIGDSTPRAFVVDRVEFDRSLARDAVSSGVDLHLKERVRRVSYGEVITSHSTYRTRIVVGADGINSVVRRSMNVTLPNVIGAAQVIAKYESESEDTVEIFVGNKVAPGFFAWVIPLFDDLAKIGVASYGHSWFYLRNLLKRLRARPLSVHGGGIPIGTVPRSYHKGMLIVGDAAGHVKATSGGGVYPGLRAARCAVDTISEAIDSGSYGLSSMRKYESCWRRGIGKELSNALYIHTLYRKIRDSDFDRIVEELSRDEMTAIINKYGDIDYPSWVVWKLFRKNPKLMKYVGIAFRRDEKR